MRGAQSISTRRAYGVQRIGRVWHRARSSVYARRQATNVPGAAVSAAWAGGRRPGRRCWPATSADCFEASPFHGEGYRKAWAKLRVAGIRTSLERVRRLMREHDLQAPHRVGHAHGPKAHDGTMFGVKYFCRSTSTILAGSDGCSFDDAPFGGRCCGF